MPYADGSGEDDVDELSTCRRSLEKVCVLAGCISPNRNAGGIQWMRSRLSVESLKPITMMKDLLTYTTIPSTHMYD